ncbi:unnamed protein product [Prunus armeniaca]|uniref:Uncharacterized protein n=1 Tax=Prunus armeniaca TaxID=36596 RepID=A0A6J5TXB7_PRUAR|nr:unnamed protein product [Prunus armeniaca]
MNFGDPHYDPLFPLGFGIETESIKELVTRSTSDGVVGSHACLSCACSNSQLIV